jgi:hypothetical protein
MRGLHAIQPACDRVVHAIPHRHACQFDGYDRQQLVACNHETVASRTSGSVPERKKVPTTFEKVPTTFEKV